MKILQTCFICNREFKNIRSLSSHLSICHKNCLHELYFKKYIYPRILKYNLKDKFKNITGKCKCCGKKVKFDSYKNGYLQYCSQQCKWKKGDSIKKRQETCLKKYGSKNYNSSNHFINNKNEIIKKRQETCLKKYGVDNYAKTDDFINKSKNTFKMKYGADNPSKNQSIKDKKKIKSLEKYGTDFVFQSNIIKEKIKETCLKKYGVDHPSKSEDIKFKKRITYLSTVFYKFKKFLEIKCKNKFVIKSIGQIDKDTNLKILGNPYDKNIELACCKCSHIEKYSRFDVYFRLINTKENILCKKCFPRAISGTSISEKQIFNFIQKIYNEEIIRNTRKLISPKEVDIYLPDKKIAIEFNGIYWHSHQLLNDRLYHKNKSDRCLEKGVQLIQIQEDEWLKKRDIVESIIKAKLGKIKNKIYARKCIIQDITNNKSLRKKAIQFMKNNHIQGAAAAQIYIGLYYNNELVSIMSFMKGKRIIFGGKSDSYEIVRFCNKLNTIVTGGANRLFKFFIKKYNPEKIISYADRRYSSILSSFYPKLGFKYVKMTQPNYYYFDGIKKRHRFNYRKDVLIKMGYDKNKSEFEITDEMGLLRIFDSGQILYRWNKN